MGDCIDCKRYPKCPNEERCWQCKYKYNRNKKISETNSNVLGQNQIYSQVEDNSSQSEILKLLVEDVQILRNENTELKNKINCLENKQIGITSVINWLVKEFFYVDLKSSFGDKESQLKKFL